MADVSVGYALQLARFSRLDGEFGPATADYRRRLEAREGFRAPWRRSAAGEARVPARCGVTS